MCQTTNNQQIGERFNAATKAPYLNFIKKFSIEKCELIGDLVTAEVVKSSRSDEKHTNH